MPKRRAPLADEGVDVAITRRSADPLANAADEVGVAGGLVLAA
ncbi:hypothetical protein [Actinomadura macra]|nr:hypothetical protein [Actinomadura macra]